MDTVTPDAILAFWFGQPGTAEHGQPRMVWFRKDTAFDDEIRRRFLVATEAALAGELSDWAAEPPGLLALLILLDQFPRNLFRGEASAFAGDEQARQLAAKALEHGWDEALSAVENCSSTCLSNTVSHWPIRSSRFACSPRWPRSTPVARAFSTMPGATTK